MFEAFVITLFQAATILSHGTLPGHSAGYSNAAAKPVTAVATSSTATTSTTTTTTGTTTPAPATGSGGWGHD